VEVFYGVAIILSQLEGFVSFMILIAIVAYIFHNYSFYNFTKSIIKLKFHIVLNLLIESRVKNICN